MQHKSILKEFLCRGMALSLPSDAKAELKHKFLQNIRVNSDGVLESRPRLTSSITLTGNTDLVHSFRKIIDKSTGIRNHIAGAGTKLFTGATTPLAQKATGFSGNPLSVVNFRPEESIETYSYISDGSKMVKVSASDILAEFGITAPTKPIIYEFEGAARKVLDNLTAATEPSWTVINGAKSVIARVNTTVSVVIPDGALPDYVSIIPTTFTSGIQPGAILTINGNEEIVESVLNTGLAAGIATISGIVYDSGTTGLCHITLSIPVTEIYKNSILYINAAEYVRVLEVTRGNDGIPVIYTSTTGTRAVGNTVQGFASFRIFTNNVYVVAHTIVADGLRDTIAGAAISELARTVNLDLTNASGEPLSENAIFHISLRVSNPTNITEIQIQLGFDTAFLDYIYYPVSPNFLTANTTQAATSTATLQSALQRTDILNSAYYRNKYWDGNSHELMLEDREDYINYSNPTTDSFQTALGSQAWTEIAIPFKSFTRVGSDSSKSRKDVKAIKVTINVSAAVTVDIDSIWVGGASGLDSIGSAEQVLLPYNYVYRFRDPTTKAVSNWSPPIREGLLVRRNGITISIPANTIATTYKVDIGRIGGTQNDFRMLGSIFNDGSTFSDNVSDDLIADNEKLTRASTEFSIGDFDWFKPFAILDKPKSGTCNVIGTELTILTGALNTSYPRGTEILVDNRLTTFYSNPTSTTKVSLEDNLEVLTNVKFEIKEPLLTGQPLPIIAGPHKGVIFGAGDVNAAGTVYFTDPNSPDTMSDVNRIEVSNPSEPILAIVIYDDFPVVYTPQRSYTLNAFNNNGYLDFEPRENANSKGIYSKYGICVAKSYIYQLTDDGIYRSEGVGNPASITDTDLHSLFPHNGVAPQTIIFHGISVYPPDFAHPDEMRLFTTEDFVFWRFLDTDGKYVCLVYDTRLEGWISLDTFVSNIVGVIYKDEEEGSSKIYVGQIGSLYTYVNSTSIEDFLVSIVAPFTEDFGNFRSLKQFYEVFIDTITGDSLTVKTQLRYNNDDVILTDLAFPVDTDRGIVVQNINNGAGQIATNLTTLYYWLLKSGTKLFKYGASYIPYDAEIITNKSKEFGEDLMFDKFWQGIIIDADTFGEDKTLLFKDDDGNTKATLIINHSERKIKSYSFNIPFISHKITRLSIEDIEWIPYNEQYVYDREPELAKVWESQFTSFGLNGFKQIKLPSIAVASTSKVTVQITVDSEVLSEYTIPNTGSIKKSHVFQIASRRFKVIKLRLQSSIPFRFYKNELEINIREWNSQNDFQAIKPFGAQDNITGVQI